MVNEALREHTTSIAFNLTLSKAMINHLVLLHHFKGERDERFLFHPALRSWVTTIRCLEDRGLIRHAVPIYSKHQLAPGGNPAIIGWKPYRITKAGTLVVNLLKEAGIYQERLAELMAGLDSTTTKKEAS